ncbi:MULTISPECIES: hypothetical protein [unclassified Pseudomonas]|uniref:hypothetical protein n=1 Tax=unclassified Pseudomonas TaxID=196821 RepID=UPI000BC583B3|nr:MULTISPECIES: hypothetical protein [unclassified Pseudomonas]PVZ19884.1 hypothetical protein F474_00475 [Pseudomonas sp. URIL14HWK12:I12]PVZ26950.1 hypothetical protein F470_00130 [Pseudomonas sp. URIL14HWK12:I10]PVZ37839.1 hypothetical protein F472_00475 [Pseudomonas sp. URIL14HWK12:I11]SNZ05461.1 hypothetical protein SAMN05660463_00929 [Pseudomonas sp. URIL14HWK12:I9]
MPNLTCARPLTRFRCNGCNWTLAILGPGGAVVQKCPWCGCDEFGDHPPVHQGAGQSLLCDTHGEVVVQVLDGDIACDDFMDNLYCPFCR